MPDVVITEFMDESSVDELSVKFDVFYSPDLVDRAEELNDLLVNARAIIVRKRTQVSQALLDQAPELKVVGRLGIGLDNIDLIACGRRGVQVCPATGANDAAVAEYVITTALTLQRGAYAMKDRVVGGQWPRQACMGREIGGKTLGLVGFGSIARETAKRALALGMEVMAHDPFIAPDDQTWEGVAHMDKLTDMLSQADIVSLHISLTDATRNLMDAEVLAGMKPGAMLINTARGGVVDETALVDALKQGRLGGVALDVYAKEPVDAEAGAVFKSLPNLILTPHIAGVTLESNVRVSALTAANVRKILEDAE
ncbi:MAG: hydroxyacid dehydrogenase [Gammaproteobacteria bacterium]|nr:hydroxyacid dehydrogenase [Gammaproteobacteria bacterium]